MAWSRLRHRRHEKHHTEISEDSPIFPFLFAFLGVGYSTKIIWMEVELCYVDERHFETLRVAILNKIFPDLLTL